MFNFSINIINYNFFFFFGESINHPSKKRKKNRLTIIHIYTVGSRPQLIGFIRFGEPVPHGLSARPRVWAGPTKG